MGIFLSKRVRESRLQVPRASGAGSRSLYHTIVHFRAVRHWKTVLSFSLPFFIPIVLFQGGGEAPKNLSGRLVAATWWLFGFIIIASYTANLAAFLTVSRLETPVESLEDLSKQYKIQYSPQNGSATMTYFERMAYIEEKFYEYASQYFKTTGRLNM